MATQAATPLPDDPATLKAMLLAERARAERLEQIIKELQRHRFGRRAETLPEDQLLLGLEEAEQSEADVAAEAEDKSPAERAAAVKKRRTNRGSLPRHPPRIDTTIDIADTTCPCCKGQLHRIRSSDHEREVRPPGRSWSGGPAALRMRPGFRRMLLDPLAQYLVDARLPARTHRPEKSDDLRGQPDMGVDLGIGLLRPAPRTGESALRRLHHLAAGRDLGALELVIGPGGCVVGINPGAPGSGLFRGHCIFSSISRGDPRHAGSRPP